MKDDQYILPKACWACKYFEDYDGGYEGWCIENNTIKQNYEKCKKFKLSKEIKNA